MKFTYRPLPAVWPSGARTPYNQRQYSRFRASWPQTLELLQRELAQLGVRDRATVVMEAGYRERDIRLDGLPRAAARLEDPAVVISFDSKHGPLRYGCDTYHDHQDNVRAIALALEALRAVDRYGVTKRGEQYTGWKALPEAPSDGIRTTEDAMAVMRTLAGQDDADPRKLYRLAAHAAHPDYGGKPEDWKRLQRAKEFMAL